MKHVKKYCPRVKDRRTGLRAYRKLINGTWRDEIPLEKAKVLRSVLSGYLDAESSYKLDELALQVQQIEDMINEDREP